mmetsp:Transcript_4797/g.19189  ORF Transcript_4797/g.19189 Transcript_4797/m.19189 type:complete len:376 (-) Transcript_4797:96-1223(-)
MQQTSRGRRCAAGRRRRRRGARRDHTQRQQQRRQRHHSGPLRPSVSSPTPKKLGTRCKRRPPQRLTNHRTRDASSRACGVLRAGVRVRGVRGGPRAQRAGLCAGLRSRCAPQRDHGARTQHHLRRRASRVGRHGQHTNTPPRAPRRSFHPGRARVELRPRARRAPLALRALCHAGIQRAPRAPGHRWRDGGQDGHAPPNRQPASARRAAAHVGGEVGQRQRAGGAPRRVRRGPPPSPQAVPRGLVLHARDLRAARDGRAGGAHRRARPEGDGRRPPAVALPRGGDLPPHTAAGARQPRGGRRQHVRAHGLERRPANERGQRQPLRPALRAAAPVLRRQARRARAGRPRARARAKGAARSVHGERAAAAGRRGRGC